MNNKAHKVKKAKEHEFRIASELSGNRELRSGANAFGGWSDKTMGRDITTKQYVIEHKNTEKDSISLKKEWLLKIKDTAVTSMKDPLVVLTFQKGVNRPEDWVLLPLELFKRLQPKDDE